jgi:lipid-binding SYLF domain-containing protein
MIATQQREKSPMSPTQNEAQAGASQGQSTAASLLDKASRIVIERPGTCLAAGFVLGGALAWLMSKRN